MYIDLQYINILKDFILLMTVLSMSAFTLTYLFGSKFDAMWTITMYLLATTVILLIASYTTNVW